MRNNTGTTIPTPVDMTALSGASVSVADIGEWTGIDCFERQIISPSDAIVGTNLTANYDVSCDADVFGVLVEGEFA